jgi:hypothetical protein
VEVHVEKLVLFTGYSGTRKEKEYRTLYPDNKRVSWNAEVDERENSLKIRVENTCYYPGIG